MRNNDRPRNGGSQKSQPTSTSIVIEPIAVRIPAAVAMTGLSRSRLYELIKSGELQIAKDGASTLILVASLRAAIERRQILIVEPDALTS